jgi:hypothetical protein
VESLSSSLTVLSSSSAPRTLVARAPAPDWVRAGGERSEREVEWGETPAHRRAKGSNSNHKDDHDDLPLWLRYFEHLGEGQRHRPVVHNTWERRSAEFGPFHDDFLLLLQKQQQQDAILDDGTEAAALDEDDDDDDDDAKVVRPWREEEGGERAAASSSSSSGASAIPIQATRREDETSKVPPAPDRRVGSGGEGAVGLVRDLERAVHRNDYDGAVRAFHHLEGMLHDSDGRTAPASDEAPVVGGGVGVVVVPLDLLARLSWLVGSRNDGPPFVAHRVLKLYQRQHRLQKNQQGKQEQEQHDYEQGNDDAAPTTTTTTTTMQSAHIDPELINFMVGWYKSICHKVRHVDPQSQYNREIQGVVRSIVADLMHMTNDHKKQVYPILISSLVQQRSVQLGLLARPLFDSLLEIVQQEQEEADAEAESHVETDGRSSETEANRGNGPSNSTDDEGPLGASFLEHLIGNAKFRRHDDLPYPTILRMLAERRRPFPVHAVAVLENLFPFDDLDDTAIALRTLVNLQTSAWQQQQQQQQDASSDGPALLPARGNHKESVRDSYRYVVDMSTLEAIGAAAARQANVEVSLLVWDAVHVMGHRDPATPAIYESLALVFCAHRPHYGSAFTVLAEMQERGYPVPRALIRSMSTRLRYVWDPYDDYC